MRLFILLAAVGCDTPNARAEILICEATGASPADDCTTDMLLAKFHAGSQTMAYQPGAVFVVVTTAGTFGEAVVTRVAVTPTTFGEDPDTGRAEWENAADRVIREIRIPSDTLDAKKNKSNLLSAVSVATAEGNNYPALERHLTVASDGMFISLGRSLEHDPLTADIAVDAVEASGLSWDLSGWNSISFCGWHAVGISADAWTRRRAVWDALIAAGNGPAPGITTSCGVPPGGQE